MDIVKVSSKGQVVIPKSLRESQRIDAGTELTITVVGEELRLRPVRKAGRPVTLKQVAGLLRRKGDRMVKGDAEAVAVGRMLVERDEASKK